MNEKVLQKLEYNKIVSMLADKCSSQMGKEIALSLLPSADVSKIRKMQEETSEAKEIMRYYPNFTLGGFRDIRKALKKAEIGGVLEPGQFLAILDTLDAAQRIKMFFSGDGKKYILLLKYQDGINPLPELRMQIKKTITPEGEVADHASPELDRIRKQLKSLQGKARDKLENMVRSAEMQKYLQDPIITIRKDRYVIPVKLEYRQAVPGLVHDQSASGATLFIEPLAVVEINNETERCEAMEKAEVTRVLRGLTQFAANRLRELQDTIESLSLLDFIFARAKLSADLDCGQPAINEHGYINIIGGRHPLLAGKVVPITIHLGRNFDTLVITGPNTGGKTVTLKTVGLFTLMAQAGLHVPAETGTELAVFRQVFADIGDEQSIEQSLSTFSSHMTNIIEILKHADDGTLVLLDELGAGTDPTEGATLAMAILEYLIEAGTRTIATTHYSELKSFAYSRERVENASVEFDVETLSPTYRLLIGVPGKSNAFLISQRLGLPSRVVERARDLLSQEELRVSDLIENLETNQLLSEKDREEAERLKKLAKAKLEEVLVREEELRRKADRVLEKAREQALEIVMKARRESEAVLKEVREKIKKAPQDIQQELYGLRTSLREKEAALQEEVCKERPAKAIDIKTLQPGDYVVVRRLNQKAQVLEKPKNDEVYVQAGIMKLTVKTEELSPVEEEKEIGRSDKTGVGKIVAGKAKEIGNELDLRGLTVDEALFEVEKYLDDAFLAGLPQAYLIHGKGTGALRKAVSNLVKDHRYVKTARMGGYHEGGIGVTVVEFKR